jgi:hypothetical protein
MLAILPFLVQWLTLARYGGQNGVVYRSNDRSATPLHYATRSQWSLLHELQSIPESEIERFLPQICNIMLDRDSLNDDQLFDYFESIIEKKCGEYITFGTKVCATLKVGFIINFEV